MTLSPWGPKKSSVVSFKSISVVELSLAGGKIEPVKKRVFNLLSELTLIVEVFAAKLAFRTCRNNYQTALFIHLDMTYTHVANP